MLKGVKVLHRWKTCVANVGFGSPAAERGQAATDRQSRRDLCHGGDEELPVTFSKVDDQTVADLDLEDYH